jgi:hypothetical protein
MIFFLEVGLYGAFMLIQIEFQTTIATTKISKKY